MKLEDEKTYVSINKYTLIEHARTGHTHVQYIHVQGPGQCTILLLYTLYAVHMFVLSLKLHNLLVHVL